jgi:hypothetical protein
LEPANSRSHATDVDHAISVAKLSVTPVETDARSFNFPEDVEKGLYLSAISLGKRHGIK